MKGKKKKKKKTNEGREEQNPHKLAYNWIESI